MIKRKHSWQLQEAKNRLSEVVRLAQSEGPQTITVRGAEAVVVVSAEEYRERHPERESGSMTGLALLEYFQRSPLWNSELELERDQDGWRDVDLGEP